MLRYVTTNEGKVREARAHLPAVDRLDYDYPEVQAATLAPIAAAGARAAHAHAGVPVLVDDAGLFVDGLDGFPGPYSSFVEDTLGVDRVRRLVETDLPADERDAEFRCVLAYCDGSSLADAGLSPVGADGRDGDHEAPDWAWERADGTAAARLSPGDDEPDVALFAGRVRGRIVPPRGTGGFGYDPIFEYEGATFAERDAAGKNEVSHRGRALAAFADWYAGDG